MIEIRPVRANDLDALYAIALATADGGADASALYRDAKLIGHIYAGPYVALCPETVFIAADADRVGGYIVGATDTPAFEARLEAEWWPKLRAIYPDPASVAHDLGSHDQRRCHTIHHPRVTPATISATYPSHLHINLLPRLRGLGVGWKLMDRWISAVRTGDSQGAHLAVGAKNARAIRFYEAYGFRVLDEAAYALKDAVWMGLPFGAGFTR
jgi:ribosomal protein S18 acetylase RimI-like enzyme